jgi:hypothetical protein
LDDFLAGIGAIGGGGVPFIAPSRGATVPSSGAGGSGVVGIGGRLDFGAFPNLGMF